MIAGWVTNILHAVWDSNIYMDCVYVSLCVYIYIYIYIYILNLELIGRITCVCVCVCVSRPVVSDSATPWTVAYQKPQSMGFSRQDYWSGLPFPSPGYLPGPGIEPRASCIVGRRFSI